MRIARAMSALVNSQDDDGAILGNWSEDFSGGTAPTKWIGSVEILQQYYRKRKPVRYGQCWTFAGTLTASEHFQKKAKKNQNRNFPSFLLQIFSSSLLVRISLKIKCQSH